MKNRENYFLAFCATDYNIKTDPIFFYCNFKNEEDLITIIKNEEDLITIMKTSLSFFALYL